MMRSTLFAVALLAMSGTNAAGEPLGRLFFTPQQRGDLDRLRESNGDPVVAAASKTITVNGMVQRSNGKNTAWINRSAREAQGTATGAASGVAVELPSGKNVHLKAGQTYDLTNGRVSEPYEHSPVPAPESGAPAAQGK